MQEVHTSSYFDKMAAIQRRAEISDSYVLWLLMWLLTLLDVRLAYCKERKHGFKTFKFYQSENHASETYSCFGLVRRSVPSDSQSLKEALRSVD